MKRRRLLGAVVALGAAAALTLTACSSDSDDSQPAPASSDPAATALLNSAADTTAALTGVYMAYEDITGEKPAKIGGSWM